MTLRSALTLILIVLSLIIFINRKIWKHRIFSPIFITRTAVFASISIILYLVPIFNISLPFFPSFLNVHIDEIPAFIAGFAYGPLSGFLVIFIKTVAKLPLTTTGCVGEFADLLYSLSFVLPAAFYYRKHRKFKGAIIGFLIGTVCQLIVASFVTSFLILDFYIFIMGLPKEAILQMCKLANPNVTSLGFTFLFLVAIPFNAFKDLIVIVITLLIYKKMHLLLEKVQK